LQSPSYWQSISEKSLGIAIPNVNASKLKQIEFPLAPLREQHRIVAKIEELFTRLDAGIAALKRAQAGLKRYKAAALKAACEGRLVPQDPNDEPTSELLKRILAERRAKWEADLRAKGKDPKKAKYVEPKPPDVDDLLELPSGWCWVSIDQISERVTSGSRGWAAYYADEGSLFIRVGNFNRFDTRIDLRDAVFVETPQGPEADRTRLKSGDLLMTITADVGMVGVVDDKVLEWGEAFINQHVALVRPVMTEVVSFIAHAIAAESIQAQIRERQYGATKIGLGLEDVKSICISLPPLVEQRRIVAEVERRLSVVEELEATLAANLVRADRLRQSTLKRAFAGQLVPQNLRDEPASELLERIHAERERRKQEIESERAEATKAGKQGVRKMKKIARRLSLWETLTEVKKRLTPEELFRSAGFTVEHVDEFYEELRREVFEKKRIRQVRPNQSDVFLEAVKR